MAIQWSFYATHKGRKATVTGSEDLSPDFIVEDGAVSEEKD